MKNKTFAKFKAVLMYVFRCFMYVFVFPVIVPIGAAAIMLLQWGVDMPETLRGWRNTMYQAIAEAGKDASQLEQNQLYRVVSK